MNKIKDIQGDILKKMDLRQAPSQSQEADLGDFDKDLEADGFYEETEFVDLSAPTVAKTEPKPSKEVAVAEAPAPAKKKVEKTLAHYLESIKGRMAEVLPRHMTAERLARVVAFEYSRTPALQKCSVQSLIAACMQSSILGLEPGPLGHIYFLPFENRKKGITEVQVIVGYRGLVDMIFRSGKVSTVQSNIVREGEKFELQYGRDTNFVHVPNPFNKGKRIGVYAYATGVNGELFGPEVLSEKEVESYRARSKAKDSGPWVTDTEAMWKKTAIRRLKNYCPMSVEQAQAFNDAEKIDERVVDADGVERLMDTGIVIEGDDE